MVPTLDRLAVALADTPDGRAFLAVATPAAADATPAPQTPVNVPACPAAHRARAMRCRAVMHAFGLAPAGILTPPQA
ncbi:hypothetical protein AB0395_21720 [Streptosporangium sp. NPDC051023]|uniref:hypothetical protein n=1 Tax=Streptosporangium sp. NPDC051023 TaxID=3155410 RepID=UPI00344DCD9D